MIEQLPYNQYAYIFPPRAEFKISPADVEKYDNGQYLAQPKYNGCCCNVFINEQGFKVMNRHNESLTLVDYKQMDFASLHKGKGWMVLSGELLNKNKRGEDGAYFNQKFIIWDILVYEGKYLVGWKVVDRVKLLEQLWPCNRAVIRGNSIEIYQHICNTEVKGIYKAPTYVSGFSELYQQLCETDLYEGMILKRAEAKLELGFQSANNSGWQLKCRKTTKNYLH